MSAEKFNDEQVAARLNLQTESLKAALDAADTARQAADQGLAAIEGELGLLGVAAVIDLQRVRNGSSDTSLNQRVAANMTDLIRPGKPYCILRAGSVPLILKGALPAHDFLRPTTFRDSRGRVNGGSIVYHEAYFDPAGEPGIGSFKPGIFSAIADSRGDSVMFDCGGTTLLRSFFGDASFERVEEPDAGIAAAAGEETARQSLMTDKAKIRKLAELTVNSVLGQAGLVESLSGSTPAGGIEILAANFEAFRKMGFQPPAFKRAIEKLAPEDYDRLFGMTVDFLSARERAYRSTEDDPNEYRYDPLPGLSPYKGLTKVFPTEVRDAVLETVGKFYHVPNRISFPSRRRHPLLHRIG